MQKRFLNLLCTLALCLTLLPATAGASAGPDWIYDPGAQTLTSGSGADTVTLRNVTAGGSSGTELTIGSNGDHSYPKFDGSTLDLSGIITDTNSSTLYTITSIGNYAFYDCRDLADITLPNSITSIGNYAFNGCSNLADITLPDGVTSIGNSAFYNCRSLTGITLPDGITSIGDYAFENCSGLTGITLPNSVTSIGDYAFEYCSGLTDITLPDSITSIGKYTFDGCSGLTGITLPDGITSIGYGAFEGCSGLTAITLPDGVTSIENAAFRGCSGLTGITLPDGITSIGDSTFEGCSGLTDITLPDGVTSIGKYTFEGCSSLTAITLPDGVTSIGNAAFRDCSGLTAITLPDGVTSIGISTFKGCSGLTDITLPNDLKTIGESAFSGCSGLTDITLPDGVTSIEYGAFSSCSGLTDITLPNSVTSIGDYAFSSCSGLTSITLPDGITSIGWYVFSDCSGLTSITLPDGITYIVRRAFSGCISLTELVLLGQTPPELDEYALDGIGSPLRVVVPEGSVEAYKQAPGWKDYAASIEALSYGLTVTPVDYPLELPQGAIPTGVEFTITNQSNATVSGLKVSLTNNGNFELSTSEMAASLAPNGTTTFTVTPRSGLAAGSYSTDVEVTSSISDVPATARLTCTVKKTGIAVDPASLDFGSVYTGYTQPEGKTVTVTNTGEQAVTLIQPASQYYDVLTADSLNLPVGGKVTFTVQPKVGLPANTYNETLKITGAYNINADVDLCFVVKQQPGGGGTSSGGGGGVSSYSITVKETAHGTVTISPQKAALGSTVTVTTIPDEGYQLNTLTVTDGKGNACKLTEKGGGQYTFVMPSSAVTVKAVFTKIEAEPEPLPFTDVPETAWYADAVRYVYEHDLMNGTAAQKFSPDSTTSRAMIATILWRMAGSPVVDYAMDFSDVAQGQWYSEAIRWAASEGIVGGYGNGVFGTNDPITREQFAVMLYRFAQKQGYDVSVGENTNILSYADAFDVAEYAIPAMQWACGAGIVNGSGANLNPQGDATRAQAAAMLMRFCEEYVVW